MGNAQWAALTQSLSYSCCQMEKRNLEMEAGGVGVLAVSLCVISGPLHMSLSQSKLGFLPSQGPQGTGLPVWRLRAPKRQAKGAAPFMISPRKPWNITSAIPLVEVAAKTPNDSHLQEELAEQAFLYGTSAQVGGKGPISGPPTAPIKESGPPMLKGFCFSLRKSQIPLQ